MTISKDDYSSNYSEFDSQRVDEGKTLEVTESYKIPLLSEKLTINRRKYKVGEVIVRKQVETKMVQVPMRRERLIVERIGKHPEQLAEVVINQEKVNGFEFDQLENDTSLHITRSNFLSVETAKELLEAIAHLSASGNAKVCLEFVTSSGEEQVNYQNICEQYH